MELACLEILGTGYLSLDGGQAKDSAAGLAIVEIWSSSVEVWTLHSQNSWKLSLLTRPWLI